ncbi:hypothetical protein ['Cynodon dactylon' phytoplasma]|uniref:hypothetical protein n=1 Tax='Cynodon dactylon' phytoplasma TaxID=295320 RepID=UPI001265D206|nr:hypothetical protein ['Cynodon dactylon' phytoplasma]KAB8121680.1 hypothetical protein F1741_02155 ['Cynodon dactylon' phytoplasma]
MKKYKSCEEYEEEQIEIVKELKRKKLDEFWKLMKTDEGKTKLSKLENFRFRKHFDQKNLSRSLSDYTIEEIVAINTLFFNQKIKKLTFSQVDILCDRLCKDRHFQHLVSCVDYKKFQQLDCEKCIDFYEIDFQGPYLFYDCCYKFNVIYEIMLTGIGKNNKKIGWPKGINTVNDLFEKFF